MTSPVRILIPVLDDWESLALLLPKLESALARAGIHACVLVVDDGSTKAPGAKWPGLPQLGSVEVLHLKRNLGHQRAIAIGLSYLIDKHEAEAIVVMDADGEDDPNDVPRLIERLRQEGGTRVVFAERTRRAEGLVFSMLYHLFRLVHWLLTGRGVRFGNFSVIPAASFPTFTVLTELWNHYAASVVKARLPYCTLPTKRSRRLSGRSHMNFVSLVTHGLSAISVFAENVAARALILAGVLMGVSFVGIGAAAWIRWRTDLAIPGWATNVVAFFAILIVQALTACFVLAIFTLQSRSNLGFVPARDHQMFIRSVRPLEGPRPDEVPGI